MNYTAKKLREAADYMASCEADSAHAIATVRRMFDVVESDTFGEDLGRVLNVIADELDALQARAAGANDLRQQLESAENKAERRKRHIGYLNTALHDKNGLLQQRGGTIARLTAENSELRKQVPSGRERQILDMWPRFEDGEPVMVGDKYEDNEGNECFASGVHLDIDGPSLVDTEGFHDLYRNGKRVNRPVQRVLDDDGVEIEVGDTVYAPLMYGDNSFTVSRFTKNHDGDTLVMVEEMGSGLLLPGITHTRPDSWERLEKDAAKNYVAYWGCGLSACSECPNLIDGKTPYERLGCHHCHNAMRVDLIRRAKILAGIEVAK